MSHHHLNTHTLPHINRSTRPFVYCAIDGERDYQDKRWGTHTKPGIGDFIALIDEYSERARKAWAEGNDGPALHHMRKIAALAVRAMEIHGAQTREQETASKVEVTQSFGNK